MSSLYVRDGISTVEPPLSQAVGYIVVVLIGIIIALGMLFPNSIFSKAKLMRIVMMLVTKILKKTTGEDNKKTEMYNLASA